MRVLDELAFAAENPDRLVGYDFGGSPNKPGRVYNLAAGAHLGIKPSSFPELTLNLGEATVLYPNIPITDGGRGDLVDCNNGYTSRELLDHNIQDFPLVERDGRLEIRAPQSERSVGTAAYVVACGNYSSFLLGEVPRIKAYRKVLGDDFNLVVHGEVQEFHRELLAILGIKPENLIHASRDERVRFEQLIHTTPTFFHHSTPYRAIEFLRNGLGAAQHAGEGGMPIYLSRSRLGGDYDRMIVNESEVEATLAREGFEILHPQDLTVGEQIRIFSGARTVVSPFGATWANSVFRNGEGYSCLLATKFTPEFARIFQALGIDLDVLPLQGEKYREGANISKTHRYRLGPQEMDLLIRRSSREAGSSRLRR